MAADKDPTLARLYTSEVVSPGIVIQRSNPDLSPEERLDIVATRRMAQLTEILGPIATKFFTKEGVLKF